MLDYCDNCDVAWLDGGEWDQLGDIGLRNNLGTVFTDPWQSRVRNEIALQSREDILRDRFGEDYGRVKEFRPWLQKHPKFEAILAWICSRNDA